VLQSRLFPSILSAILVIVAANTVAIAQRASKSKMDNFDFGPVMQAYLGYLRNEQEVVDDRISRREINANYYRRNSNRIRALREMAIRLVTKTGNDYVPELEAVTPDELGTLFEKPPSPRSLRINQVIINTFRYLGAVNTGELFHVFARLDPYEQAALIEGKGATESSGSSSEAAAKGQRVGETSTRPRRTSPR